MPRKLVVPSSADIAKKWGDEAPRRAGYYEIETPKAAALWETNATVAKGTYKAAVADPKVGDRFAGGIKKAGAAKFSRKVTSVGVGRYGPGITAAVGDMESGFAPYQAALAALEVPDRGPRGDPKNKDIVGKIFDELHKKRLAVLGAAS